MKRLIALILLFANPAMADVLMPDGSVRDCYCTDSKGERVDLGETICLFVDGRYFTAQCQMSLTNPMWRELHEGCVSSRLKGGDPAVDTGLVDS